MSALGLDPVELSTCVQCGLCLPYCPTFRITGDESQSPRGRIALMRAVERDGAPVTPAVRRSFETCVQCRGCETACPSAVPFGHLMAETRASLAEAGLVTPRWQRAGFAALGHPRLLRGAGRALALAQRARLVPTRLGLPALPIVLRPLRPSGSDVVLFTGCVMDAWQRPVHHETQAVLEAAGFGVRPSGDAAPCCGALPLHAGLAEQARRYARRVIALGGEAPVLVNSAGCAAAMKEYGRLIGTEEARAFSGRIYDVAEWLAPRMDRLPSVEPLALRVAVQDPCHLRHAQRAHLATRTVLAPFVRELVELDDEGLCCGAGGAYAFLEPAQARAIRDRKIASIVRAAPDVVASANPGCMMHLAAGGARTAHPMTLVARALERAT